MRAAGLLSGALGLSFGLPCAYAIRYLAETGRVWTFLGFPTYGDGPFERIGIKTTIPLLVAFLLVCAAELVAGALMLRSRRAGALLSMVLLPLECAFWIGFALPLGPVAGLARTVLIARGWSASSRTPTKPRHTEKTQDLY